MPKSKNEFIQTAEDEQVGNNFPYYDSESGLFQRPRSAKVILNDMVSKIQELEASQPKKRKKRRRRRRILTASYH